MDCSRTHDAIFQFFDQEMDDDQASRFHRHLAGCPRCARRREVTTRWLIVVRSRAVRYCASEALRRRILASLPHRQAAIPTL